MPEKTIRIIVKILILYPVTLLCGVLLTALIFAPIDMLADSIFPDSFRRTSEIFVILSCWLVGSRIAIYIAKKYYEESEASWGWLGALWDGLGIACLLLAISSKDELPKHKREKIIKRHNKVVPIAIIIGGILNAFVVYQVLFVE